MCRRRICFTAKSLIKIRFDVHFSFTTLWTWHFEKNSMRLHGWMNGWKNQNRHQCRNQISFAHHSEFINEKISECTNCMPAKQRLRNRSTERQIRFTRIKAAATLIYCHNSKMISPETNNRFGYRVLRFRLFIVLESVLPLVLLTINWIPKQQSTSRQKNTDSNEMCTASSVSALSLLTS